MIKTSLINILLLVFLNNFIFLNAFTQIENAIVVKIGEKVVTSVDLQNKIYTSLFINKQEFTQKNIDAVKNFALKSLINNAIKKIEVEKYKINDFNEKDLDNYINGMAKNFDTDSNGLKKIFKQANLDFQTFEESHKIELIWNTLIFTLYRNQMNVNIVDVDNELQKISKNKTEVELKEIKEKILLKKKNDKLKLFSRSHFSNLENTIPVNFQ